MENLYRCVRCGGSGYHSEYEGEHLVVDPCLHCNGKGHVPFSVANVDRHEALCELIANSRVNAQRKSYDESDQGEGWAFHAAENMMTEYEYTQSKIWDAIGIVQNELKALSEPTLNALCDLLNVDIDISLPFIGGK